MTRTPRSTAFAGALYAAWLCAGIAGCGQTDAAGEQGSDVTTAGDVTSDTGADTANLTSDAPFDDSLSDQAAAPAPKLAIVPPTLDFGAISPGSAATLALKIFNTGTKDLVVTEITVSPTAAAKHIMFDAVVPFTLAPKASKVVTVTCKPDGLQTTGGQSFGELVIVTNVPNSGYTSVPLFAIVAAPKLHVTPANVVDFAIAATGTTASRTVVLANVGALPLGVHKLRVQGDATGEFAIVAGAFGPTHTPPWTAFIAPQGQQAVTVTFSPQTSSGTATAKLVIDSEDLQKSTWTLPLVGVRAESGSCSNIQLQPAPLNVGLLAWGESTTATLEVRNLGIGHCYLHGMKVLPCPTGGFGPLASPPTCTGIGKVDFALFGPSIALLKGLGPGEQGPVHVRFTAPYAAGFFFADLKGFEGHFAFAALRFGSDPIKGDDAKWYPHDPNAANAVVNTYKPNLEATVGTTGTLLAPKHIDFNTVAIGCSSPTRHVVLHNTGNVQIAVTAASLVGCGTAVTAQQWPAIPLAGLSVHPLANASFGVRYSPTAQASTSCDLRIVTNIAGQCADTTGKLTGFGCKSTADCAKGLLCQGVTTVAALAGQATTVTAPTDTFVLRAGNAVDLLFVVDNTWSMGAVHKLLGKAVKSLLDAAAQWQVDVHIGVTTADMDVRQGRLIEVGGARILTATAAAKPTGGLVDFLSVGTAGTAKIERFGAMMAAVSYPHVADTCDQKCAFCQSIQQCASGSLCVPDAFGTKACGGSNRTLRRKHARLAVVLVGDQADAGKLGAPYIAKQLANLKANGEPVTVHAIVGTKPGNGTTCKAQKATETLMLVSKTGGTAHDICAADYNKAMATIGAAAFGGVRRFKLTMAADAKSLQVSVDGKACAGPSKSSWQYDAVSNTVSLAGAKDGGTCGSTAPAAGGGKISISYQALCSP